ncbi:MAG: hypothetical protein GX805_06980 [Gammaproteobacteria bacterium]|jgi:hypothetical protein|nr:hypothetical protein [Gammaproteobacteria bacterium]
MTDLTGTSWLITRIETGEARATDGKSGVAKGTGGSWFEVLAQALGGMLGDRVMALVDAKNRMVENYSDSADQQSKEYMEAMTDFQVQSQLFGMESQMSSTAIKSIGEGLISIARKQ